MPDFFSSKNTLLPINSFNFQDERMFLKSDRASTSQLAVNIINICNKSYKIGQT